MDFRIRHLTVLLLFLIGKVSASEDVRFFSVETGPEDTARPRGDNFLSGPVTVTVNVQQSVSRIGSHFIGVNIDTGTVKDNWISLNFSSKKVLSMAQALAPTYFRLGGTYADAATYDFSGGYSHTSVDHDAELGLTGVITPFNMTAKQWVAVSEFTRAVGWDMIMDLNALKRNADGTWNPDNARQLLQFSADRGYRIAGFQLGNEYDYYQPTFNITVSPPQLAKDIIALKNVLSEFPNYYSAFVIGPEVVHDFRFYVWGFLISGASNVVRAATFHQYYFFGLHAKLEWFTDVKRMDGLAGTIDQMFEATRAINPNFPVWLSETSSAYGGGAANISDRFVAGFLWLDKLGVCALKGVETVLRQDFYGGNYALIDYYLNPNPDFWLTVLYKRIVHGPVFSVTGRKDIRVYSACANTDSFSPGSLAVYILNPNNYSVTFDLPQFKSQPRYVYSLTAGDEDGLLSKFMALNGKKLELVDDKLPELLGQLVPSGGVTTAPYSYTFVVFHQAAVSICREF
ncbi:heparanase-like [Littorina saxatilis]|uniref:Glycoside hydrolase family 79 n=1 Tax=Littorina saxatilis TaxID=31220 RepID=A0AAN9AUE3_9CAEN